MKKIILSVCLLSIVNSLLAQNVYPTNGDIQIKPANGNGLKIFQSDYSRYAEITLDQTEGNGSGTPGSTLVLGVNNGYGPSYKQRILFKTAGSAKMVIEYNGNVGIGTTNPEYKLEVFGSGNNGIQILNSNETESSWGLKVIQKDNLSGEISCSGRDLQLLSGWDKKIILGTTEYNQHGGKVLIPGGGLGIGTDYIPAGYKLAIQGKIISEAVTVKLKASWPDYVFQECYSLKPLSEVESFIKENKHLPEVPSALEVEKNGISLGDMDVLLIKKIEELTLYIIEIKKENDGQKIEIEALRKENEDIKKLIKH